MRYLIILFTLFLTFVGKSQTGEVVGAGYVISSSGSDPNFTVTFSYTSALGWATSDITTSHYVMVRSVIGATHSRNIYDITSVSPSGGNVTLGLTRITGVPTATFPSGTHPIIASPGDGLLYDAPNISQMHDSYLYNYNLNKLFGNEYNAYTVSGDSVFIHNGNGDSLYVGADISAVAVQFLNDLDDVTLTAPGSGQLLLHDGVDWKNKTMTGNVVITGAGVATISNNAVTNPQMATMPSMTIKGNNEVTTGSPEDLTTTEVKVMLDIDHLTTLSGVPAANNDLGSFTGTTIPDNSNNKEALQALETGVEGKLPKSLPSAQIYVGNAIGNATAVTMSGDATISNTGVVDIAGLDLKNTNIQFKDEGVNLGTSGTVDEVDFTGAGVTATRLANKVTVNVPGGGGGGATNLAYVAAPSQGTVTSDTGTDAVIPVVDAVNAGLATPSMLDASHDSLTVNEQVNGVDLSFTGSQQLAVDLNPNELTLVTAAPADVVMIGDASDSYNTKKVLVSDFGGGGGATNLTYTSSPTQGQVNSDTGTDAVLPTATTEGGSNIAGLMTPAEKGRMTHQTIAYSATINSNMNNGNIVLVTMTGDAVIAAPTNTVTGEEITYILTASGANRTATFAATVFKEEDGSTDTGAKVIPSGTTIVFKYGVGPTVLSRVGGGTSSGGTTYTTTTSNGARITYRVLSGTPTVTMDKTTPTAPVLTVSGGTIRLKEVRDEIATGVSINPTYTFNATWADALDASPSNVQKVTSSSGQYDDDTTPQVLNTTATTTQCVMQINAVSVNTKFYFYWSNVE